MSIATKERREIGQYLERELKLKDLILMVKNGTMFVY